VGSEKEVGVDVRILAATHRDLKAEVQAGRFREDLFFRLNVVRIDVPPLRERPEDIPLLAESYLQQLVHEGGGREKYLSAMAMDLLTRYRWPGNVRELQNAIERAVVLSSGPYLTPADFPAEIRQAVRPLASTAPDTLSIDATLPLSEAVEALKRAMVLQALTQAGGNQRMAAKSLGVQPSNLSRLMSTLRLR
jgi:two-component system response regulator HydG